MKLLQYPHFCYCHFYCTLACLLVEFKTNYQIPLPAGPIVFLAVCEVCCVLSHRRYKDKLLKGWVSILAPGLKTACYESCEWLTLHVYWVPACTEDTMKLQCLSVGPPVCLQRIISEIIGRIKRRIMRRTGTQDIKISYTVKVKKNFRDEATEETRHKWKK